ncbi:MAG: 50S ribosomal protein L4 [Candidatus Porifericomitaceae bacterium WSBS_2022_MAG_OTU9]
MDISLLGSTGSVSVADSIFASPVRHKLIHQVVTAYRAAASSGTKANKSRGDVRGGGAKPWRQKGTGRARAGSRSSPLWRSGGVTFAAHPRDMSHKVNRKMYRSAMCSIFSDMANSESLKVVAEFSLEQPKTKVVLQKLKDCGLDSSKRILIVLPEFDENIALAVRNLPTVATIETSDINPYDILRFDSVVLTEAAVRKVEAWLS